MNLTSEHRMREHAAINSSNVISESDVSEQGTNHDDKKLEGSRRAMLVGWLNSVCPESNLPKYASDEEFRTCLFDGNIFVNILNRLKPVYINEVGEFTFSRASRLEKLTWFLAIVDKMGVPGFFISDLDKGSMKSVMDCLFALREQVPQTHVEDNTSIVSPRSVAESPHSRSPVFSQFSPFSSEQRRKLASDSTFQHTLHSPTASGHKFHEVFQRKQGRYLDLPAAKISEMMTSNSLDNAPTQSLLSVVNGILDESVERKTSEIPHRVTCLLRKVVQEIERRISTQAEHLRTQNNLFKSREEKYQSRIRVLEALAAGSGEEIPAEKIKVEDKKKIKEEEKKIIKEEKEKKIKEEEEKIKDEDMVKLLKEKEEKEQEILALKQELEAAKKINELQCMQMEAETKEAKENLGKRLKDLECLLADSRKKVQNLEAFSESKSRKWSTKEHAYQSFMDFQSKALQELRFFSDSIKQEIVKARLSYSEEFNGLGEKLKALLEMAEKYNVLLAENRKMLNEIQELKGNIRVYCRIRPFLASQRETRTTIEYVGESGELVIANPSKQGKEGHRLFKFNKVFGPVSSQAEIFSDIQPLIQSVLDGYNVCIFAYGQTGSGKTYTMMGPNASSKENWGVNYRALNDLFNLSQSRRSTTMFEIGVQIVEIYNEQVRDLLSSDSSHKRLGIMTQSQPYGLAVPDANMVPVKSTSDVIELMDIGLKNRAIGATALNERSSRSHSVVTVHVRGTDMKTATSLHGNLHLVDLAGSERVDRSEVTGDRLREAQHINKSLSALGDVIFSLAQKSSHVPYRNSKLTQLLQSSLGGQAKTLMFVQLNPDVNSYSESLSTLKFAERVSGVELGAARSSKEGRDVRELMDQVASLKDTILRKDDEIERLQLLKDLKNVYPDVAAESRGTNRNRPSFPNEDINGGPQRSQKLPSSKGLGLNEKTLSDNDTWSEYSDINSEVDSLQSMDDFRQQNKFFHRPEVAGGDSGQNVDDNIMRFVDPDYGERLADISDHSPFSRVETTVTAENSIFAEGTKSSENLDKPKSSISPRLMQKSGVTKDPLKVSSSTKKPATGLKPSRRWQ